nr:hypothetical protein Iba_scaffold9221CG0060 [Ipomoea batatas]GME20557.1 hypothetical protein Iba_scaffold25455CG0020 [Ipomoea batatas]
MATVGPSIAEICVMKKLHKQKMEESEMMQPKKNVVCGGYGDDNEEKTTISCCWTPSRLIKRRSSVPSEKKT